MNKIKLYYWQGTNFGDEISPYIIEKLSGKKVIFRKTTLKGFIHQVVDSILKQKKLIFCYNLLKSLFSKGKIILGAGSIAAIANSKTIIWGSGLMVSDTKATNGYYLAVRGQLTAKIIKDKGLANDLVLGDPGLLMPIVYPKTKKNTKKIGIAPHIKDYEYFKHNFHNNYKIIDLATTDVERVINEVLECEYILSTSLHGIIVAHAYNIPAIWIEKVVLEESGFKFFDYFSSVKIKGYKGYRNLNYILSSPAKTKLFFEENKEISLPNINLASIQKGLIEIAPFEIQRKFKIL